MGEVQGGAALRLLVAAGGTGGHLYPAIAVAERFLALAEGAQVSFVGTARGLESRIVPKAGFPLHMVRARPLRGGSLSRKLAGVSGLALGLVDSFRLLRRLEPSVVMGVGAYVSGAISLTASLRGIPTLLLEPNAEPGLANRWLAPFVDEAACAFPETARHFGSKGVVTGNPVRNAIAAVAPLGAQTSDRMRVLVFGGSQGSTLLNQAVLSSLSSIAAIAPRLALTHQTGPRDLDTVRAAYEEQGLEARVVPYIDDMASAYEAADLVLSRAGATTCAELACAGRPSLLVPLALAGGHQEANAEMMARAGASRFLRESELSAETLTRELESLLDAPEEREHMAASARSLARPDAADAVARRLLHLAQRHQAPREPREPREEEASQ